MKPSIYLVVGVPGSGKTWCCSQLTEKFCYVHHDDHIYKTAPKGAYVKAILSAAESSTKPVLIEAPFSISETKDPLEQHGHRVIPLVILEDESVLRARYQARDKKPIPHGHITRMQTYAHRAKTLGWFYGTSNQVLEKLKSI